MLFGTQPIVESSIFCGHPCNHKHIWIQLSPWTYRWETDFALACSFEASVEDTTMEILAVETVDAAEIFVVAGGIVVVPFQVWLPCEGMRGLACSQQLCRSGASCLLDFVASCHL